MNSIPQKRYLVTNKEYRDKERFDGRGKNTPKKLKNNALENLQTLCIQCHSSKDSSDGRFILNFKTAESLRLDDGYEKAL